MDRNAEGFEHDDDELESGDEAVTEDELDEDSLADYIVDEVARAFEAHDRAGRGTVQRILPLGEMLALFNLADQFGLIDRVRADLDSRRGANAYLAFSEAMKAALLDRGFGPSAGGGGASGARPAPPRGNAPRQGRPPEPGHDRRPRQGPRERPPGRPPGRGGGRPPGSRG